MNGTEYFRKTISATGSLDVNVLYLGGMPQMGRTTRQVEATPDRSEIAKPPMNFKGIIQDVQVIQSVGPMAHPRSHWSSAVSILQPKYNFCLFCAFCGHHIRFGFISLAILCEFYTAFTKVYIFPILWCSMIKIYSILRVSITLVFR
jgi:hypothetical protein